MKEREFLLLNEIAKDETVTQAGLAARLDIAVGSVNWYIKRLIGRGYLKATRMDRTRLHYNLTPEGMTVLTRRAAQYMKDSLTVYRDLRQEAGRAVQAAQAAGAQSVYLQGDDEAMDILRLTCIEQGLGLDAGKSRWVLKRNGRGYLLVDRRETA
ncbi:MAG: winged helix-turn-helix transcriptional regulator [Chloroflexi bacterium]|nr:winged helix-turn-helix transcriptional regulator [Chloroflexota bacterium]